MAGKSPPFTATAFYAFLQEERLMASRCRACGLLHLPPRPRCLDCQGQDIAWAELQGKGVLATFTCIFVPSSAMKALGYSREHPYCSGLVRLTEGPSISALISGVDAARPDSISIGMSLQIDFSRTRAIRPMLSFRPA